jgi:type I restriction enzyme S subunit
VQETGTGQVENGESIASAKQVVKKPVVLVSKLNPRKATICLAKPQTILTLCSTEFVALNADKCELAFLEYLTRSELFRQGLDSKVQSVTRSHQRANPADIYKFWNAWPTLEDQRSIAAFLDRETGRVDRLVAKKRELIERLKEKRIALISRTVTRGLPPAAARAAGLPENPTLKPSGIEWVGEVPNHWELTKMSWVCASIRDGTHNPPDRADGIHRLLSVRNVQDGKFALLSDDRTMTAEDFAELQRSYTVEEGDIVLAIVGATTGKSAIVGKLENVTVQRSLAILRPNKSAISSSFLHYVIQSPVVQTEIELTVFKYSAQPGIYLEDIGRLLVVRPPLPEQAVIAAYLDAETAKLDALVGKVAEAVERLQEYRTALITAAVTGKIDVRGSVDVRPGKKVTSASP